MKKTFLIGAMTIALTWTATPAQAQLGNILNGVASALGAAQNSSSDDDASSTSSLIGNLISSVTGGLTTTAETIIGTWSYTDPCVQFESENALTSAGGSAIATRVEEKIEKIYKKVGIKEGALVFTFLADGTCSYGVGSKTRTGTYTFDNDAKTITITTTTGREIMIYTTVTGSTMALTFDASKLLELFKTISSKMSSLSTLSAIAGQYTGMKLGFKLAKQ